MIRHMQYMIHRFWRILKQFLQQEYKIRVKEYYLYSILQPQRDRRGRDIGVKEYIGYTQSHNQRQTSGKVMEEQKRKRYRFGRILVILAIFLPHSSKRNTHKVPKKGRLRASSLDSEPLQLCQRNQLIVNPQNRYTGWDTLERKHRHKSRQNSES